MTPATLLLLPGALGSTDFWRPVAGRLAHPARKVFLGWPGFHGEPADPVIHNVADLAARVAADIDGPTALIAQSMGGLVALLVALQKPEHITHLVLSATSGGLDMDGLGAADWRPAVRAEHPGLPDWFLIASEDLTPRLPALDVPALLLWGDADPISPVAAGQRLASVLPRAHLHIVAGGGHALACAHADAVAPLIDAHLRHQ